MFSTLILTLDEEATLDRCLASAAASDDVVVLDSGSTDGTCAVARRHGVRVFSNPFESFAQQRNFAHASIEFRHPWVFHLDADEQLTPELAAECAAFAADAPLDGCYVAPRMLWDGRWIRHSTDYPTYQARFVRAKGFEFVQSGHGQREAPTMRMGKLQGNYVHDMTAHGIEEWKAKHRRYAQQEAAAILADADVSHSDARARFFGPAIERRRALKRLSQRLPGRGWFRFVYQYLLRGGFLDGAAGLRYCRLLAWYERCTASEIRRLRREPS